MNEGVPGEHLFSFLKWTYLEKNKQHVVFKRPNTSLDFWFFAAMEKNKREDRNQLTKQTPLHETNFPVRGASARSYPVRNLCHRYTAIGNAKYA